MEIVDSSLVNTEPIQQAEIIKSEEFQQKRSQEVEELNKKLRPQYFDDYVGQDDLKNKLKIAIEAAKNRNEPLCSILISAFSGSGKSTIADIIANEYGVKPKSIMAPVFKSTGDLLEVLTKLEKNSILHIDEIHGLKPKLEETLYCALDNWNVSIKISNKDIAKIHINPFCLIGTTTFLGDVSEPLRNRFGICHTLSEYSDEELSVIIKANAYKLNLKFNDENLFGKLAACSRGVPRNANRLLNRIRDYAQVKHNGTVNEECLTNALELEGVKYNGFTNQDIKYLQSFYKAFGYGPAGLSAIASVMNEEPVNILQSIEPFLLRNEFLIRTKHGRYLTSNAVEFILNQN